jgi:two-component system OmpR family sensor kinase
VSLRLRLLVGLAVLVLGALVVFGAGTYLSLDHFLRGRLDQQLATAAQSIAQAPRGPGDGNRPSGSFPSDGSTSSNGPPLSGGGDPSLDDNFVHNLVGPDLYVAVLDADGATVHTTPARTSAGAQAPKLSEAARRGPLPARGAKVIDASAAKGGAERIAVAKLPDGGRVVVAGTLRPVTQTLHRLLLIEAAAGATVILVTLGLGVALARMATKPLEDIAEAADAISAGDLDHRLTIKDPDTEAGRVGTAFNAMLTDIQQAFARRDATERRLRRFVADASHELSTPLTSIRGYAELFHRGLADRPDDLATAMGRIEAESVRMSRLVDDLLLLAKLDSGRPLDTRPVDLAAVVTDAASDLRVVAPEWPVTVEVPDSLLVLGDEDRLRQVVANLTSNAHRYTPSGTAITLRASTDGDAGVVEVVDEGPGLTEEQAAKVFERFYRVDAARSRAGGGSGLGLAIVASLVEAMGGQASVDTAPGRGTAFRIRIPLAPAVPA